MISPPISSPLDKPELACTSQLETGVILCVCEPFHLLDFSDGVETKHHLVLKMERFLRHVLLKHGSAVAGYGAFVYIGAKQGSQQMLELTDSRNQYCPLVFQEDMKKTYQHMNRVEIIGSPLFLCYFLSILQHVACVVRLVRFDDVFFEENFKIWIGLVRCEVIRWFLWDIDKF